MKFSCFLFLLIGFVTLANAECQYSKYQLHFEIITNTNRTVKCYKEISSCYFNPQLKNDQNYLRQAMLHGFEGNHIPLYKNRMGYKYCIEEKVDCLESEQDEIYTLFDEFTLSTKNINSIKLLEHHLVSVFDHVASSINFSDTGWLKKQPVEVFYFHGYLCYHNIIIHKANKKISEALVAIKKLQSEIDELEKENSITYKNGDEYDAQLADLVDQLPTNKKMVVISGCTD